MKNNNDNDIGNLDSLTAENMRLRARLQDLETYIDGRKTQWTALTLRLRAERQVIDDLKTAVQIRDARISGFARTSARLERRVTGQEREIELLRDRLTRLRREGISQPDAAMTHSDEASRVILRAAYDKLGSMRIEQKRLKEEVEDKNTYIDKLSGKISELELERSETVSMLRKQSLIIDHIETEIRTRLAKVASNSRRPQQRRELTAALHKLDEQGAKRREKFPHETINTMGRLTLIGNNNASIVYEIGANSVKIGRGPDNDIRVRRQSVSREHARLTPSCEGVLLEDLGSRNGVRINDQRVHSGRLHSGDIVMIGQIRFRYTTLVVPFNRHHAS